MDENGKMAEGLCDKNGRFGSLRESLHVTTKNKIEVFNRLMQMAVNKFSKNIGYFSSLFRRWVIEETFM